jgi:hypothetical protein
MRWRIILPVLISLLATTELQAQWRLEGWFGSAINARSDITFEQEGQPDIVVNGEWSTRPWRPTWYYAVRVARWSGNAGWAFEAMHHKIYLDNPPAPEVTRFRITNGVNHLLVERLWRSGAFEFGVGAGPTFVVPVSTVRGQPYAKVSGTLGSRYEFGGFTGYATVSHRFQIIPRTYGSLALKTTVSPLSARIAGGEARTTNFALHLQYGISLQNSRE